MECLPFITDTIDCIVTCLCRQFLAMVANSWKTILNCFVQICRQFIADCEFKIEPTANAHCACLCFMFDWYSHCVNQVYTIFIHSPMNDFQCFDQWNCSSASENPKINRSCSFTMRILNSSYVQIECSKGYQLNRIAWNTNDCPKALIIVVDSLINYYN